MKGKDLRNTGKKCLLLVLIIIISSMLSCGGGGGGSDDDNGGGGNNGGGDNREETYNLTVKVFGNGSITSNVSGISCGQDCSETYEHGTVVALKATPAEGEKLLAWSGCDQETGDTCTVVIDGNRLVHPTFGIEPVYSDKAKPLSDDLLNHLVSTDGSTFIFDAQATELLGLTAGDIIGGKLGEGFIRKVKTVTQSSGQIVVETEKALIGEAIVQGTVTDVSALTYSNLSSVEYHQRGVRLIKPSDPNSNDFTFEFDNTVLTPDWSEDFNYEPNSNIKLSGNVHAEITKDIAMHFDKFWGIPYDVKDAKFLFTFATGGSAKLEVKGNTTFDKKYPLATLNFGTYTICPFVYITPKLTIYVGVRGSAEGKLTSDAALELSYTLGVTYDQTNGLQGVSNFNKSFTWHSPVLEAKARVEGYLRPELVVDIDDILGPYINIEGYLGTDVSLNAGVTDYSLNWKLYAGLDAHAGIKPVEILGIDIWDGTDFDLINPNVEWVLTSGTLQSGPSVTIKSPLAYSSFARDSEIQFESDVLDIGGTITSYAWDFGSPIQEPVWLDAFTPDYTTFPLPHDFGAYASTAPDQDGYHSSLSRNDTSSEANPKHSYPTEGIYDVTLTVTDNIGLTASDTIRITIDSTPPAAPTGLNATAFELPYPTIHAQGFGFVVDYESKWTVGLNWNTSSDHYGVTGYKVYRDGTLLFSNVNHEYAVDIGLEEDSYHCYAVSAVDEAGNESPRSQQKCITVQTDGADVRPPSVPRHLRATGASESQIDLTWDASTDNVGVTGYKVYRDGSFTKSVTSTSTSDTGPSAGSHCYSISALDDAGNESGRGVQACATAGKSYEISDFWPLSNGNTWNYDYSSLTTGKTDTLLRTVNGTEAVSGITAVKIVDNIGSQTHNHIWDNSGKYSLYKRYGSSYEYLYTTPLVYYPEFVPVGTAHDATGSYTLSGGNFNNVTGSITMDLHVDDEGPITVLGKTYNECLKMTINSTDTSSLGVQTTDSTEWFCRGVGMVKKTEHISYTSGTSDYLYELKNATVDGVAY